MAYTVAFAGVAHYNNWWGLDWIVLGYPEGGPERLIKQELKEEKYVKRELRMGHVGLELNSDAVAAGDDAKMRVHFEPYQEEHRQAIAEKVSKILVWFEFIFCRVK